ncbi:Aspartic proteinase nepenthesin-1 [Ananas comosus]|uniref:Aspartic proteinase nepenthesin-1 n=1 Tax=Ananas comosus TaxID=4615 RepID=A0A199UFI7_ANACO|nr:Aspartic proteinase nepenthesin-1 [Ananas comosus]
MSTMAAGATLSLLVLLLITSSSSSGAASSPGGSCSVPPDGGSTLRIIHAFGPCSPLRPAAPLPSWADFLSAQSARDDSRLLYLSSLAATAGRRSFVPLAPGRQLLQIPNYVVRAGLGSPPQTLLLALDNSNDAAWVPCSSCAGCPPASPSFSPPSPPPSAPSLRLPACSQVPPRPAARQLLLLQHELRRLLPPRGLVQDSSPSPPTSSPPTPSAACRGFKSLNFSGTLRLGPKGQPQRIKTTPLLANPHRPSLYYVNMTGVRVGRRVLPIPPSALAFDPATGAGTVVDAGTMFTRLAPPAYAALRDEFRLRVRAPLAPPLGGFDTCYNVSIAPAPAVTFLFDGAAVTLPEDNVLIHSTAGTITCLAMAAAPDGLNAVLNVIANMQQQNHRVLFDVPNARVGFAREMCT